MAALTGRSGSGCPDAASWVSTAGGGGRSVRSVAVDCRRGEASAAWIGLLGQNPRKGVTHTREDVAAELADVVFTALVAIESLGLDARTVLESCANKVRSRLEA